MRQLSKRVKAPAADLPLLPPPDNLANLNTAEFCNRRIDAQVTQAVALQASD